MRADRNSTVFKRTQDQDRKIKELEAKGWEAVTEAESVFDGAVLLEGPTGHCYVCPDGSVKDQLNKQV